MILFRNLSGGHFKSFIQDDVTHVSDNTEYKMY